MVGPRKQCSLAPYPIRVPFPGFVLTRQRYFFTAENAENAENGGLLWPLLSNSAVIFVAFPCFLTFSAFSATSAVKSRVVGLACVEAVRVAEAASSYGPLGGAGSPPKCLVMTTVLPALL